MVTKGQIVRSKNGRDAEKFLVVVGFCDGFVLLSDGKERPLERPKRKNIKHISPTNTVLCDGQYKTNRSLRHTLHDYSCGKMIKRSVENG